LSIERLCAGRRRAIRRFAGLRRVAELACASLRAQTLSSNKSPDRSSTCLHWCCAIVHVLVFRSPLARLARIMRRIAQYSESPDTGSLRIAAGNGCTNGWKLRCTILMSEFQALAPLARPDFSPLKVMRQERERSGRIKAPRRVSQGARIFGLQDPCSSRSVG
jgi:hypothetical protein